MGSTLCLSLQTWWTSLYHEHNIALLTQCQKSITCVRFPDIFLINGAISVSC
jgi:hypothetical protein